jgi:hypothetical protein
LELLKKGYEQILKRYSNLDAFRIVNLLNQKEVNVELGFRVLSSKEEVLEYFEFLPRTYDIYGIKFWFDKSDGIELDFSFNINLNSVIRMFKLIDLFNRYISLYEKGILEIEPFTLENSLSKNAIANFERTLYELNEFNNLGIGLKSILPRMDIIEDGENGNFAKITKDYNKTPSNPEITWVKNDFPLEYEILNEINDLYNLVILLKSIFLMES